MTKEEIELVSRIDIVLNYINSFTGIPFKRLFEIQNELPTKINYKELIEILYKLEKDNHLHAETPSEHVVKNFSIDRQEIYYSTFQGRLFALRGGYLEEYKSLDAKKHGRSI